MFNGLMTPRAFVYGLAALMVATITFINAGQYLEFSGHSLLAYAPGEVYYTGKSSGSDATLQKKVRDKITTGWFSNYKGKITVQVQDGHVTLIGHVKTEEDKKRIEAAAIGVNGVKSLDSQLIAPKSESGRKH